MFSFVSFFFYALKFKLHELKFDFCQIELGYRITDKLAINWQNSLKFEFSSS